MYRWWGAAVLACLVGALAVPHGGAIVPPANPDEGKGGGGAVDLQAAINVYLVEHNAHPKSFVRTKSAAAILAKLNRLPVLSV
jgi:hypothetical protein